MSLSLNLYLEFRMFSVFFKRFASLMCLMFWVHTAVAGPIPADQFVKDYTEDLLETIAKNKQLLAGDQKKVAELVDTKILPAVNFQRMTALVVGRYWRQATPEQKERLIDEFRGLLTRTYSGALAQVKDLKIEVKPLRGAADENDVVVKTLIIRPKGEPIQLDYRLERSGDSWKIFDVNVAGLWLVETYKTQFASEISKSGIDGLISSLSDKAKVAEKSNDKPKN
jgi:phospholipid transport system substrate-binding protein